METRLMANVFCGKRDFGDNWIHVDMEKYSHIDNDDINLLNYYDLELIYCSHGLAYFDEEDAITLLFNWLLTLKSGGILRIATPDYDQLRKFDFSKVKGPLYGKMISAGEIIHHKTCYTFERLKCLLEEVGFVGIERYDHTKTEHPNTGNREDFYDDHSAAYINGVLISLNVQCRKP